MKTLNMQQIQSVYGGAYSCTKDDGSDCSGSYSDHNESNSTDRMENLEKFLGHTGGLAGGFVGTRACGERCGMAGSIVGSEALLLYLSHAKERPEDFHHPDYPDYNREAWDPKLRK